MQATARNEKEREGGKVEKHARGIPQGELDGLSVEPDLGDIVLKDGRFIVARKLSHRKDAEERRFPARAVADDDEFAPERAALYVVHRSRMRQAQQSWMD